MHLPHRNVRLVLGLAVITLAAAGAFVWVTFLFFMRAQFPQRPMVDALIPFLERGADAQVVLAGQQVAIDGGGTWVVVTDASGMVLASNARDTAYGPVALVSCREAGKPVPPCFFSLPSGSLPQSLTVLLPDGLRYALIARPWHSADQSGFVFAGRTRGVLDERWLWVTRLILATWLAGLGAFFFANRTARR